MVSNRRTLIGNHRKYRSLVPDWLPHKFGASPIQSPGVSVTHCMPARACAAAHVLAVIQPYYAVIQPYYSCATVRICAHLLQTRCAHAPCVVANAAGFAKARFCSRGRLKVSTQSKYVHVDNIDHFYTAAIA
jgi:hypothetical protein